MKSFKQLLSLKFLLLCVVLILPVQAHALLIDPDHESLIYTGPIEGVPDNKQNSNKEISDFVNGLIGEMADLLYKTDDVKKELPLYGSYTGTVSGSSATIEYNGQGGIVSVPSYLLVKDGNHDPYWYLFNLTEYWDGVESVFLQNFWPGNGGISYVALYGTASTPIPEPATMLLLGVGVLGIGIVGRKKLMNKRI